MIHNRRKIHGEADCVVYGLITDAVGFWFYRISNDGEVWFYNFHRVDMLTGSS
jgi:hypothetical protein